MAERVEPLSLRLLFGRVLSYITLVFTEGCCLFVERAQYLSPFSAPCHVGSASCFDHKRGIPVASVPIDTFADLVCETAT